MLLDVLKASGVHTEGTKSLSGASGHAVIQVDQNGQNNIIICGGANDSVSKEMIDEAVKEVEEGDIVLLQNEISFKEKGVSELHGCILREDLRTCRKE